MLWQEWPCLKIHFMLWIINGKSRKSEWKNKDILPGHKGKEQNPASYSLPGGLWRDTAGNTGAGTCVQ